MLQYMSHTEHGRMPVYTPTEVEANQKHGWVLEAEEKVSTATDIILKANKILGKTGETLTPAEKGDGLKALNAAVAVNDNDLKALYFAKFGKKPHHRMKPETIKAALDGSTE